MATPISEDQFISEVRGFMRDHPDLNQLIYGEESTNRQIRFAAWLAIDEWNVRPPVSSATFATFPSRFILLFLTIIHLLTSVGLLKARNSITYNDGGFSVQDNEAQERLYKQWIQVLRAQVDPVMRDLKISLNIAGGWGAGVGSTYGQLHGWYGS